MAWTVAGCGATRLAFLPYPIEGILYYMASIGLIGGSGSGLAKLKNLQIVERRIVRTPYGEPSGPLSFGRLGEHEIVFVPRHGYGHTIPPHQVNYRANVWALAHVGVQQIIAIAAVGGIAETMQPGVLSCPDQLIDYTYGRQHTYFEGGDNQVVHIDFTNPYCERLRAIYGQGGTQAGEAMVMTGVYAATQGPRLETAAEIRRIEGDGGDIVGMTGAPEAQLARELGLCYAPVCMVVNAAAGKAPGTIDLGNVQAVMTQGIRKVRNALEYIVPLVSQSAIDCACCHPDGVQVLGHAK